MTGTYVYCLVAGLRRPLLRKVPKGLPGMGPVRLLEVEREQRTRRGQKRSRTRLASNLRQWLVVSEAPLDQYGEGPLNRGLADLDWVAHNAVAHEAVVESFSGTAALLPMKLFTIFASDDRALEDVRRHRERISALLARVVNHEEWGVRLMFDRGQAADLRRITVRPGKLSGAGYLARKKAQRDGSAELALRASEVVADLYDDLVEQAAAGRRRSASELPLKGGPILLDAAFLVPRTRASRFRASVARRARSMAPQGYRLSLTGPWPPYSFMKD